MELIERVEQLESKLKARRPDLHFPSTATLEHRIRWLEIVLEEMRAEGNHGVYAETLDEEKLRQVLGHSTLIKGDRITKHSLTADPASCVAGDTWFRSDLGKVKLATDAVVANAKLLRREGDVIATAEVPNLDVAKITSGRFGMARLPDGISGVLTAKGAGVDPAYEATALPSATVGDVLVCSNDAIKDMAANVYTKAKEIQILRPGAFRIKFWVQTYLGSATSYARIYRNGTAVGTERSGVWSGDTFSEDISGWSANDLVQIYINAGAATTIRLTNFRLYVTTPLEGGITLA